MAWTTPMTAVANDIWTSAQYNTHVRDNLLEQAPAKATAAGRYMVATGANAIAERQISSAVVTTAETTTSTSFTDLTTSGPAVTLTTGTQAIVWIACQLKQNATGTNSVRASYAVSGATTIAADAAWGIIVDGIVGNCNNRWAVGHRVSLTAGSNTFTMKYLSGGGTTSTFAKREIIVMAL